MLQYVRERGHDSNEDRGNEVVVARTDVGKDGLELLNRVTPVVHTPAQQTRSRCQGYA